MRNARRTEVAPRVRKLLASTIATAIVISIGIVISTGIGIGIGIGIGCVTRT